MSEYEISADKARLDVDAVARWLSEESYWAVGRDHELTARAIEASVCVAAYAPGGELAGFARVVTDHATFAWLCDVFVVEAHRGHGLARRIVRAAMELDELATVRLWLLATNDAHGVYAPLGFEEVEPGRWMKHRRPSPAAGGYREP